MKLSLVNLAPLKEGSMQARELADRNSLQQLQRMYDELLRDMEQEAEPEGGPIADQYADQMQDIEDAMQIKRGGSGSEMTYDDMIKKHYGKSPKGAGPGGPIFEATEKSWNAVDVSRKAEKEIGNKEWNERTAKKLDMLKTLNAAGKFKKDWDEEKLQGWVDQNYSWEKLSRQFKLKENKNMKLKEAYSEMYENPTEGLENQALQVTAPNGTVAMITDPRDIGDFITGKGIVYGEDQDGGVIELHIDSVLDYHYVTNEGSCGYSQEAPGGEDLKTPGGTKGMPADTRTMTMMREVIKKEISKLSEESDDEKSSSFLNQDKPPNTIIQNKLGDKEKEELRRKLNKQSESDHGKLSKSGEFRIWDKKTDMMGNPRGTTHKDKNAWGFPKKK